MRWGFSARDASGIVSTALQVSYAVGLTALGGLFLGQVGAPATHASGHAFMTVSWVLGGLAVAAAGLAAVTLRAAAPNASAARRPQVGPACEHG